MLSSNKTHVSLVYKLIIFNSYVKESSCASYRIKLSKLKLM